MRLKLLKCIKLMMCWFICCDNDMETKYLSLHSLAYSGKQLNGSNLNYK